MPPQAFLDPQLAHGDIFVLLHRVVDRRKPLYKRGKQLALKLLTRVWAKRMPKINYLLQVFLIFEGLFFVLHHPRIDLVQCLGISGLRI